MNINSKFITPEIHYDFMISTMPKKKVFIPYKKKEVEKIKDLKLIQKWFNINEEEAKEYLKILSKEQIKKLKEVFKE
jgi:hypothetical protein